MPDTDTTDWAAVLTKAGSQLTEARSAEADARQEAALLTRKAFAEGMTEVAIAECLTVNRATVRAWLGKERKRNR